MSDNESHTNNKRLVIGLMLLGLILIFLAGGIGYQVGRSMAMPETVTERLAETVTETVTITETVTEQVEVTREVIKEVEVPAAADESVGEEEAASGDTAVVQGNPQEIEFGIFYEAWELIEELYDGDIPQNEDVLYSAIDGSLETLHDEHTRFIRPEVAARMREDATGNIEGIGAFVRENEEGLFEIVRPIPGHPAEAAGLLPGDIIVEVDGDSVVDLSFDEVILLVRGPQGTEVTIGVLREGEEDLLHFTITRVRIENLTVEYEMLADNIAYVHLNEFNQVATDETLAALDELLAQNPQALIFDLRDNPGGFLNQSVSVADIFLSENVVLFERNRNGLDQTFSVDDGDKGETIPLVVLVNPGSASASEIVAGAIQDHGRGTLIGETTFGKGSVQQVHELSDGSEVRVTIARWYTPNNNTIEGEGITPDIEVPMEFGSEEDIQLDRAIELILEGG
jgi:carboxyl-terminal processing protease